MTKEELEPLGYKVHLANDLVKPICNVTVSWGKVAFPPRQLDLYVFDVTHDTDTSDMKKATYLGTTYLMRNRAGHAVFRTVELPKKLQFALDPGIEGLVKFRIDKLSRARWELIIPQKGKRDVHLSEGWINEDQVWQKANMIEELGGFEEYLDTLD